MGRIADPQEATFERGGAGGQHSAPASRVAMKNGTEKNGPPITVVVRRRVKQGRDADFEAAMRDFIGFAPGSPGHLSIHVLPAAATGPPDYPWITHPPGSPSSSNND